MKTLIPSPARCAAVLILLASSSFALAADATSARAARADTPGETKLAHSDMSFVNKIAKLGIEEVQLSKLAATQASRDDVRSFAQKLVAAHEKVNSELSMLASSKGLVLPTETKLNIEKWSKKRGNDFDKDYLDAMIDAHKDAVDALEKNATKAEDSEVAAFARDHLPAMQEHLRTARELKKSVD